MIKKKYKFASIATDVVIFTIKQDNLQVLLIKMKKKPYENFWAAPGGLVKPEESVDEAAKRILHQKTGVKNVYLEQLYTFGKVNRDPFGRVVSVGYFALIPYDNLNIKTTKEYGGVKWFPVDGLPALAYDHREIIVTAIKRLQAKLSYTNVTFSLLPNNFTLSDLQKVYEVILERKLDKRNFRKKILALKLVRRSGIKKEGLPQRPADLYKFAKRRIQIIEVL